ncbi:hypothetical protein M501DRAFT_1014498 [Patellaria atrata CBS 101060]|uniref:RNase MRP protein 1 RNA binding domain-containing protein n=1 Tax=Patellaria atrata CBS 101060 TaxID=1346257 RepID=A0A9P4SF48_9PEZI|nr:hypothetical protein M501DRAFT_1014498 [Patellaria atrata CBS 101060]
MESHHTVSSQIIYGFNEIKYNRLIEIAEICKQLRRRHANQFRRALWYNQFQRFGKELRRLIEFIDTAEQTFRTIEILSRVQEWSSFIIHWTLSASQLIADVRYASIGVAWLGLLAEVSSILRLQELRTEVSSDETAH